MTDSNLPFLPYGRQDIDEDDIAAVEAVLRSDFLTTGPAVETFEKKLCGLTGAGHAVACSSGTAALHLAALALGLGPGDEVIVPSMTFLATVNAARFTGAEIVFSDVDPDTGLMREQDLAKALQRAPRAQAVFPVHLRGQTADLKGISRLAREHGLRIVEDACHALGTVYGTEKYSVGSCTESAMTIFSFHPVKTIAMGEGGAISTNDHDLAGRLRSFRNHGMTFGPAELQNHDLAFDASGNCNPWYYEMPQLGFNYRASDIHCALGASQLGKLDKFLVKRRLLAKRYDEFLAGLAPDVIPVPKKLGEYPCWHLYGILVDFDAAGMDRAEVMNGLRGHGIGTQVHYIPVHLQPYYRERYGDIVLPGALRYYERCLSLPLHTNMTEEDVDRVIEALAEVLGCRDAGVN